MVARCVVVSVYDPHGSGVPLLSANILYKLCLVMHMFGMIAVIPDCLSQVLSGIN